MGAKRARLVTSARELWRRQPRAQSSMILACSPSKRQSFSGTRSKLPLVFLVATQVWLRAKRPEVHSTKRLPFALSYISNGVCEIRPSAFAGYKCRNKIITPRGAKFVDLETRGHWPNLVFQILIISRQFEQRLYQQYPGITVVFSIFFYSF